MKSLLLGLIIAICSCQHHYVLNLATKCEKIVITEALTKLTCTKTLPDTIFQ